MPDTFIHLRSGEQRPVYARITAQTGSLTITGAPTCTLYDLNEQPVTGFNNVTVTGYDTGTSQSPRAWLLLNMAGLPAGWYTLRFKITAVGADGLTRKYVVSVEVAVDGD